MNKVWILFFLLCSCYRVSDVPKPQLSYNVQDRYLQQLPSPFPSLTEKEKHEDWGKEYLIALGFAKELDLYQALTAFKRASFLLEDPSSFRKQEIDYDIFLCYYLGGKYKEAIDIFENSTLSQISFHFPAYEDAFIMAYDTYLRLEEKESCQRILYALSHTHPHVVKKLTLAGEILEGDIPSLEKEVSNHPEIQPILTNYALHKKSVSKAQLLNTFCPGAGYLYVGQKQSALTAFVLNGLFIWGSVYSFQQGNIALGSILASFEAGWYFGGIYGAGLETKFYNERIYETVATPVMQEKKLFPILMLKHAF